MDIEEIIRQLTDERTKLDRAIQALQEIETNPGSARAGTLVSGSAPANTKRRGLTAAGRKRLSELAKQRWAERRRQKQQTLTTKHGKGARPASKRSATA